MPITIHHPRIRIEHALLQQFFGDAYWFEWEGAICAEIGLFTNAKNPYAVRLVLPCEYPDVLPEALVTHPTPLLDRHARPLADFGPDARMHILWREGPYTSICHYHPSRWAADMTLYKVAIKARIWLEAYELHLATGKPIDNFLSHMTETP